MNAPSKDSAPQRAGELAGIAILALMAVWFLRASWRKWPDPIIDSGPQWYDIWRVSLGAVPYHDFNWYYGPFSILFNGLLFKTFGPGMMVLAVANLVVYGAIVVLAYLAFRLAWGRLAAFCAVAVFISVFSFSILNGVGNYNYVLPYANEATHGILLLLLTAFVAVRWCAGSSRLWSFALGLCGGIAAVLKPEFMLGTGVLGMVGWILRYRQKQRVKWGEYGMLLAGVLLPTLCFSIWFAQKESWSAAMIDASQAWWVVLRQSGPTLASEGAYMGFDNGGRNAWLEMASTFGVGMIIAALWAVGWVVNRSWYWPLRLAAASGAITLACAIDVGGGFEVGPCLPGLILIAFVVILAQLIRELREKGRVDQGRLMAFMLVLLAASMLVRMALRSRINHFGFVQAALAGMVVTAIIVSEVPRWTGEGLLGRRITLAGILAMLLIGCSAVVAESEKIHAGQTQEVGTGRDRFYAFDSSIDETGTVVNWCAERMRSTPPGSTLLVLPEGIMINYLSRRERPMRELDGDEEKYIAQLNAVRPDYVIRIWGDHREAGTPLFGDPGQPGAKIEQWLHAHYMLQDTYRGRKKWAFVFRKPVNGSN